MLYDYSKSTRASALKLEGANTDTLEVIRKLTSIGVPIMGHLGLLPQSYLTMGGYKMQGKTSSTQDTMKKRCLSFGRGRMLCYCA